MRWYRDSWPVGVGAAVAVIGSAALAVSSVTPGATAQTTTRARAKAPAQSPAQPGSDVTHITIDGKRHGPVFDGVGAIAGGGGNPRLLIDYPAKQQNQILNYLFGPGDQVAQREQVEHPL